MDLESLRYEVQRIDGTPESVLEAIKLLVEEYKKVDYIPKSIEYGFFEEFNKSVIDWIGKGMDKELLETFKSVKEVIKQDDEFVSPFAGTSSKRRFGAQLHFMNDFIEIYLRSDLEIKDDQKINGSGLKNKRLRKLLAELYLAGDYFTVETLAKTELYRDKKSDKTIERDLNDLVGWSFLRKKKLSPKKIVYELTNRAYQYKDRILKALQSQEESAIESRNMVVISKDNSVDPLQALVESSEHLPSKSA